MSQPGTATGGEGCKHLQVCFEFGNKCSSLLINGTQARSSAISKHTHRHTRTLEMKPIKNDNHLKIKIKMALKFVLWQLIHLICSLIWRNRLLMIQKKKQKQVKGRAVKQEMEEEVELKRNCPWAALNVSVSVCFCGSGKRAQTKEAEREKRGAQLNKNKIRF